MDPSSQAAFMAYVYVLGWNPNDMGTWKLEQRFSSTISINTGFGDLGIAYASFVDANDGPDDS